MFWYRRIFPALILVLSTCFVFGWFSLFSDEYKQLGKHLAAGAGFISNIILWNEVGYFDNAAETKPFELTPFFKQSIPLKSMSGISHNF